MLPRLRLVWLLALLAWGRGGAAQPTAWQPVRLDSVASIEFPDSVTRKQAQGQLVYVCHAGPTVYIVVRQAGNSLLGLISNSSDFGNGMVKGLLKETGGQLVAKRSIEVSGFKGVEVQFTTPNKPELPATKYTRMLVVNGDIYMLNYWTNAAPDSAAVERTRFFTSFHVKAKPELVGADVRRLGTLAGFAFASLVLAALLLTAVLLLIRRRAAQK